MKNGYGTAREAIAAHLGVSPKHISLDQRLDDLGLLPLDLVLVSLNVETCVGSELPVAELAHVETVGGFEELVSRTANRDETIVAGRRPASSCCPPV